MSSDRVCPIFRKVFIASVFGVVVCLIPNGAQSAINNTATVQWDANQESDLAGYRVYQGTRSSDRVTSRGNPWISLWSQNFLSSF